MTREGKKKKKTKNYGSNYLYEYDTDTVIHVTSSGTLPHAVNWREGGGGGVFE